MSFKNKRPSRDNDPIRSQRRRSFEEFEQRLVMSAAPLSDPGLELAALNITAEEIAVTPQFELTTQLNDTHARTGVDQVHNDYGFDGTGQTIAIIDSGIAYDHLALGGGLGDGARVVGGYDFAENDADPYDDGPAGFHGTHVAGIVGSSDADNPGVASGVDLVGLRVFDDNGVGNLEWVEQALQWVHEHRNDFENPITTVNLSIGTEWNSDNTPNWATLEEEFAQLEADGIFISVAAGNSFQQYNETGLSYPAVSSHVVPVASHGADGQLSEFSQRNDRVLVAPGESIQSTVPDHLLGGTQSNAFLRASGTSQATPYVAGASALLRQANEFVGTENIDQDLLYQQFRDTADSVFDSATGSYYSRINVQAAIESVVADQFADNWAGAGDVGILQDGSQINGTIGTVSDKDVIEFTADQTGTVTLEFDTTHDLNALVDVRGIDAQLSGNSVSFEVVAGQSYQFSVATSEGIGHYEVTASYRAGVQSLDWGTIDSQSFNGQNIEGSQWYRVTAANDGILSIDGSLRNGQSLEVRVYDANMNEVAARRGTDGSVRVDVDVAENDVLYIKASAEQGIADFQVNNLVSLEGGRLVVNGTAGNDDVEIAVGQTLVIDVNGLEYSFDASEIDSVSVHSGAGEDRLIASLDDGGNSVVMQIGRLRASGALADLVATGFEDITLDAGGGSDQLFILGSDGNERIENSGTTITHTSGRYSLDASGFGNVNVSDSGGNDVAVLSGTSGSDNFGFRNDRSLLQTDGLNISVDGFTSVFVNGGGGRDTANLFDSAGNDTFVVRPTFGRVITEDATIRATGFQRINAFSTEGTDTLDTYDSAGDDTFVLNDDVALTFDGQYLNLASGFSQITAHSVSGGEDLAQLNGTSGNDTFYADSSFASLTSASSETIVNGFDRVVANGGSGGFDRATIIGSSGVDFVNANASSTSVVSENGELKRVVGFESVSVDTAGGIDLVFLEGSTARETLTVDQDRIEFESVMQELRLQGMENTYFDGNGGGDEVIYEDFETLNLLRAVGDKAIAYLDSHRVQSEDFALLEVDTASGHAGLRDIDAVDYLFLSDGNWIDL